MTVKEELQAFCARFPDCSVVAFADISTGLVLASSAREKTTQEKLDALCKAAFEKLMGSEASAVARELAEDQFGGPYMALSSVGDDLTCFLRAPVPAVEAICIKLDGVSQLQSLLADSVEMLDRLVQEH